MNTNILIILILCSSLILSLTRALFAYVSKDQSMMNQPMIWLENNRTRLKLLDELAAISIFLFTACVLLIITETFAENKFSSIFTLASLIIYVSSWVNIITKLGNIVYPVNGLRTLNGESITTALLFVYASLHLSDLLLGAMTISLASSTINPYIKAFGFVIGIMQMIFTYFSKPIKFIPHVISIVLWCLWFNSFFLL